MMKLIVVVTCALLYITGIAQANDKVDKVYNLKPEDEKLVTECATESEIDFTGMENKSEEEIIKMMMEPKYKCFLKCLVLKQGFMDDKGKLIVGKLKEKLEIKSDDDPVLKIMKKCSDDYEGKEMDLCDKVYNMNNCVTAAVKTL